MKEDGSYCVCKSGPQWSRCHCSMLTKIPADVTNDMHTLALSRDLAIVNCLAVVKKFNLFTALCFFVFKRIVYSNFLIAYDQR